MNPTLLLRVFVAAAERACCFPGDTIFDAEKNDNRPESLSFVTNGVSKRTNKGKNTGAAGLNKYVVAIFFDGMEYM